MNKMARVSILVIGLVLLIVVGAKAAVTNIECGKAESVTAKVGTAYSVPFITSDSGGTSDSPPHQMTNDVWFFVTSPCTDSIQFDLCNSQFDTIIAVYSGKACGADNLTVDATQLINVNDDSRAMCGGIKYNHQSFLSISSRYGDNLYIRIGGFNAQIGSGNMKISCAGTNVALEDDLVSISDVGDGGVVEKYLLKKNAWRNIINSLTFKMVTSPTTALPFVADSKATINANDISTKGSFSYNKGTISWTAVSTLNVVDHRYQVEFHLSSSSTSIPLDWMISASLGINSDQSADQLYIQPNTFPASSKEIVIWQNFGFYFGYQLNENSAFFNYTVQNQDNSEANLESYTTPVFDDSSLAVSTGYNALQASLNLNLTSKAQKKTSSLSFYITPMPIIGNDTYTVTANTVLSITSVLDGLLSNDLAFRSTALNATLLDFGDTNSQLTIYPDGTFQYQPAANFVGSETATYLVKGNGASTERGVGTITFFVVAPTQDTPQAYNDSYYVPQNQTLQVNSTNGLLANDSPAGSIMVVNYTAAVNGSLTINNDGSFVYQPNSTFIGNEIIQYTIQARDGSTYATGYLFIQVQSTLPQANPDNYTTLQNTTLYIDTTAGVLLNDTDPRSLALTAKLDPSLSVPGLDFSPDGSFKYTSQANFNGTVTFTYWAINSEGNMSQALVTIVVNALPPVLPTPLVFNDSISVTKNSTTTGVLRFQNADYVTVTSGPSNADSFSYNNMTGEYSYTADDDYIGSDHIYFVASTNDGRNSTTGCLNVTVAKEVSGPVAQDDVFSTREDVPLTITSPNPLTNDTSDEEDHEELQFIVVDGPHHGTLTNVQLNGTFSYSPVQNYNGQDHFIYTAFDGYSYSNNATVTIIILPVGDPPVVLNNNYTIDEDTVLFAYSVLANDYDIDGDSLTAVNISSPVHAALFTFYPNGTFIYEPKANYNGYDNFAYSATDGFFKVTGQVRIFITPVNDPPHARDDRYTTKKNKKLYVPTRGVLFNDTDIDQLHDLFVSDFEKPQHGLVTVHRNGSFEYTPQEDFVGEDMFEYMIQDSANATARAIVYITVEKTGGIAIIIIIIVIVLCAIAGVVYFLRKRREAQIRGEDPQRLF